MRITGTPLPSWLQCLVGWSPVRRPASRAESNRPVVNPNLHDWCFRLARQAPSLMQADRRRWIERSMHRTWRFKRIFGAAYHRNYCIDLEKRLRRKAHWSRCSLTRTGRSLRRGETEGSASEAADVGVGRFGLRADPSAAAESAFLEGSLAAGVGRLAPEERAVGGIS